MSASNSELESQAEDAAEEALRGVVEYQNGRMRVRRDPVASVKALMMLRGLNSSRRGFNLAQIDNAQP